MIETYLIDVEKPIQIPAVVYELRDRGRENIIRVFLNHVEEPNIVRGNAQQIYGNLGVCEIKRPDGGKTWYHGKTKCFMEALPIKPQEMFDAKNRMNLWGEKIMEWISIYHEQYQNLQFRNSDIYTQDGIQIAGTSGRFSKEVFISRCCWYDSDPFLHIKKLLEVDKTKNEIEHFLKSFSTLDEKFFSYLLGVYGAKKISADSFIKKMNLEKAIELQNKTSGHIVGSCIGTGYP